MELPPDKNTSLIKQLRKSYKNNCMMEAMRFHLEQLLRLDYNEKMNHYAEKCNPKPEIESL